MVPEAFSNPGRFWRGNLHTHSNLSDGVLDLGVVCDRYQNAGYDFLCVSDHFIGLFGYPISDTTPFRKPGFTTLLGAELHCGTMQNGDIWHILAVGLPPDFTAPNAPDFHPKADQESGAEIAHRAREAGAFVVIAHPQWSGLTLEDALSIESAHAVEAYNHECGVSSERSDGFHTLDLMLSTRRRLNLIAADDAHFGLKDHFGGWVMVKAKENTPEALLQALKAGDFYSSQGPELHHIEVRDDTVLVRCSEAVSVIAQGHGSGTRALHGENLTEAAVPLERFEAGKWLRITVVDANGKKAWSNPIWLTD
ncbi:phosphotransferase [uncultured Shimia sp.]|uniref:PHP domain-containing protein n=1 Tax=uncultured Shimia sp. TaxID=573152 RepID=UPI00262D5AEC|nr:phosphotransferase [uncultured Shimia sp.]